MGLAQGFNADGQGNIGIAGTVSTSSPTYTAGVEAPLSLTLAGGLRVDGSNTTQPISATALPLPVGASTSALQTTTNTTLTTISGQLPLTLGSKASTAALAVVLASDQTVPISAVALPLPAGAATSALQTAGNTTLTAISAQLPTTLGTKTSANSVSVVLASDEVVPVTQPMSSNATITSVAASTTSVVLLGASNLTKGFIITNDSTSILYLAYAATATNALWTYKVFPNQTISAYLTYSGVISGVWLAANGSARVTQQLA